MSLIRILLHAYHHIKSMSDSCIPSSMAGSVLVISYTCCNSFNLVMSYYAWWGSPSFNYAKWSPCGLFPGLGLPLRWLGYWLRSRIPLVQFDTVVASFGILSSQLLDTVGKGRGNEHRWYRKHWKVVSSFCQHAHSCDTLKLLKRYNF